MRRVTELFSSSSLSCSRLLLFRLPQQELDVRIACRPPYTASGKPGLLVLPIGIARPTTLTPIELIAILLVSRSGIIYQVVPRDMVIWAGVRGHTVSYHLILTLSSQTF